jgi:hypothetical protein
LDTRSGLAHIRKKPLVKTYLREETPAWLGSLPLANVESRRLIKACKSKQSKSGTQRLDPHRQRKQEPIEGRANVESGYHVLLGLERAGGHEKIHSFSTLENCQDMHVTGFAMDGRAESALETVWEKDMYLETPPDGQYPLTPHSSRSAYHTGGKCRTPVTPATATPDSADSLMIISDR